MFGKEEMRKVYFLFFLVFLAVHFVAFAQVSTLGKEFWVGFMENNKIPPSNQGIGASDYAVLVITAAENTSGSIEYLGRVANFNLSSGQQYTLRVSSDDLDLLHRTSGAVENKGVYISSSGKIAVHAFNERVRSADGTVVLPVGTLGRDYYITSHYETLTAFVQYDGNINDESTLLVVATENDTEIEITTSVTTQSQYPGNSPFTIKLNRGQSFQLKAKADLTGSRVRVVGDGGDECKKIAVFGGNKWTSVGNCGEANDHLFQQAYPVNTWGTSFVHVGLTGRTSGELVKVLASEDGTEVRVNGALRGVINQGKWLSLEFGANQSAKIETSKPASVTVFSKSQACNVANAAGSQTGDPFMITYSPSEQFLTELTFNSMDLPSIVNHYVNIVVKAGTENQTILDGQAIGNRFSLLPSDPSFAIASVNISRGVHRLSNPDGFAAYAYGFGELESYGYAAGAALENLNFETSVAYEFEVGGDKTACLNQEGGWSILSENPDFTYFLWDFGDGSPLKEGKDVLHTFSEPGEYEVKVSAAISPNSCDELEEVSFFVEVYPSEVEILGLSSVCPNEEGIVYKVNKIGDVSHVEFSITGGEIIENYGDSVLVKWGDPSDSAQLLAIPYTEAGCPGEEEVWPVIINRRLDAELPQGAVQVCFDPAASYFYSAPNSSAGRAYDWTVSGGQIIGGEGSGEIGVVWDQAGIKGEVSYTVYSLVDALCEGTSEKLEVNVTDELLLSVSDLKNLSCSGSALGEISIQISGGVGPYQVEWAHDSKLDSPSISGLVAGTYSVKVTDQIGCEKKLENIEIVEPEPLEVVLLNSEGTSCYGKPDGRITLEITGGIPPYSLDYNGVNEFSSSITIDAMPQGLYSWIVYDSNGCEIEVPFEITSPLATEVDVRLLKPACPGGNNGELLAVPAGGVAPFVYYWDAQSTLGNQLLGVSKGSYSVSVTDANGCVGMGTGEMIEEAPKVRMPTGFKPEIDQELFSSVSNCEISFELWIYNRWGQLVYFGDTGWDGMIYGSKSTPGTYSFRLQYSFPLDGEIKVVNKQGTFVLIR
ncbi:PKD domain-containing protein [Algoriphagus sp. CAU 1675]|uniref:PKD domain-containing protein n=1 Tax=Algoriphagus sp. CAU 1675 TaxID=3032597 RepID=UPI0023DB236E|nr:PKD domain-containing protein [Algoriphagus sp. CAU 1675]MDF2159309.1 PKD domain-containing protein [Algoriphagus sp. CAU 1675]